MKKEFKLIDPYENKIHVYLWVPETESIKGVVQIIHGASEYMGRYNEFALYLNSIGFIVIGNDHLGHGKNNENSDSIYFADSIGFHKVYEGVKTVRDYIEEHYPNLPVIMFAHSMGSFIGRYAILYDHKRYDEAIFSGTGWFNPIKIYISIWIAKFIIRSKGQKYVSTYYNNKIADGAVRSMKRNGIINKRIEWISSVKAVQREFEESELCGKPFTIGAQLDLLNFILEVQDKKRIKDSASSTAIYFISGDLDALGNYGGAVKKLYNYYKECGYSRVKYTVLRDCRHEIINEVEKESTYRRLGDWMKYNI